MPTPCAYLATVLFEVDGQRRNIAAIVLAVSAQDAISAAMDAVLALHPDADIIGGRLETLPDDSADDDAPYARESEPDARGLTNPTVRASRTVH